MRQKFLTLIAKLAAEKTWWMLLAVVILTLVFGALSAKLEMSMSLTEILPGDDPMVAEFNYIFKEFNGASSIIIPVEGKMVDMIAFAEHVKPMLANLESWIDSSGSEDVRREHRSATLKVEQKKIPAISRYIDRVDIKQPVDFMQDHGLMLVKPEDLKNIREMFEDPNLLPFLTNLNNSLEKEYIESDEKISGTQREQSAVRFLDGIESFVDYSRDALYQAEYSPELAEQSALAATIGSPYMISPDRSMLLIMAEPNFSIMEIDYLMPCINGMEEMLKGEAVKYNVSAGLAGGMALGRDEMVAGTEDSMFLTLLSLMAVLVLFIVTFRMVSAPLMAVLNLLIGIVWAMGISYFLVDSLNMMTVMMSVVLVGLGIDFSIHIISVFSELRLKGVDAKDAIVETMQKVGTGIMTGGLTTAAAFLTLMIARSDGIFEFGLVCGVGIITIMIATLFSLPMMLMLREKYRNWRGKTLLEPKDVSYAAVGRLTGAIYKRWKISLLVVVIVTVFFAIMISRVTVDYNYLNMEPEGLESILLNDKVIEKFNFSSDVTMMTAKSLAENYQLTEKAKQKSSISYVESISDFLPTDTEQNQRRSEILALNNTMRAQKIQTTVSAEAREQIVAEIERLEMNVIEMQDMAFIGGQDQVTDKANRLVGNPDQPENGGNLSALITLLKQQPIAAERVSRFNRDFAKAYQNTVLDMADTSRITVDMLPNFIRDKYMSKNGERFLMTLYPKGDVWNMNYLERFTNEVLDVSPSISGTPPMFYYMLKIIGDDGRRASLLTLLVVFVFLLIDFKSIKYALIAMTPLLFGMVWMVGFMGLAGIQLTLLNVIALPLIIGIGIDDGVHILHRYRIEGGGAIDRVYRSTGKAIIITSLTTMLAFGSLVFATYRGFGSMGLALFIGVGMCLAATIAILPAILAIFERREK